MTRLPNVRVPDETDLDDDIREAVDDAYSNAEGHASAYYLRYELKRRGMKIVQTKMLWAWGLFIAAGCFFVEAVALWASFVIWGY